MNIINYIDNNNYYDGQWILIRIMVIIIMGLSHGI
jgi:hypothetical protein